ncbi:MAG: hypothetical protein ABI333_19760 [bacterium]
MNCKTQLIGSLCAALLLAIGCGPSNTGPGQNNNNPGNSNNSTNPTCAADDDQDGICNEYEDAEQQVDTDGDGIPDYLDLDSDNDGIADSVELGPAGPGYYPVDSDADGIPDFRDLDSDGNGLSDSVDGAADLDSDGVGNYADTDDDGDGIFDHIEMGLDPYSPLDSDGDGVPDYQDVDSDNDTILDLHEGGGGSTDSDGDGLPDYLDLDSDNDGLPDSIEAGDANPNTIPIDTDGDNIPNYRDPDSDGDGLMDGAEDANHNGVVDPGESDPLNADTDGDGVTDLIELAAGTDPQNPADNPQANGDFYFVVPYEEPTDPTEDTLEFRTSVQYGDVYFLVDRTGSMIAEHQALGTSIPAIMSQLSCQNFGTPCQLDTDCGTDQVCFNQTCIQSPLVGAGCVADLWTGAGTLEDCNEYVNLVNLQANPQTTANAIAAITTSGGTEQVLQAPMCVADPSYCSNNPGCGADPSVVNPVGCPGFRPNAVRILIEVTDAGNQAGPSCGGVSTPAMVGNALAALGIKFVGLYGTDDTGGTPCSSALTCTTEIGIASGSVDVNNQPFIYSALDAAVVQATITAVLDLVRGVPLEVVIEATDLPGDAGDALQFIDYLEVNLSGGPCSNVNPVADMNSDGHDDAFPALLPGTPVCWDVHPILLNDFVPATTEPQVFRAELTVYGDGSPLDSRQVFFLVPPVIEGPIIPQ